jgi:hypothetical protein
MLIHGAWLSARSWDNYVHYFEGHGFAVTAPEWPRKVGDVERLHDAADEVAAPAHGRAGPEEVAAGLDSWLTGVLDSQAATAPQAPA